MATIRITDFSADDVPANIDNLDIDDFEVDSIDDERVEFENGDDNVRLIIEGDFDFDPDIIEDPDDARNVIEDTEGDLEQVRIGNLDQEITLVSLIDADVDFDDVRSLFLSGDLDDAITLAASLSPGNSVIDGSLVPVGFVLDLRPGADNEINGLPLDIADGAVIDDAIGSAQDDTIGGNGAANALQGGGGDDVLGGGSGDDTIEGNAGNDTIGGGKGNDILRGLDDDDTIIGGAGSDTLEGGAGEDQLDGGNGADTATGGGSADQLLGGAGNDALTGNKGDDEIEGGAGNDTLTGGLGADTFVYTSADDGVDTITDLEDGDVIDLAEVLNFAPEDDVNTFVAIDGDTLQVDPDGGASFTDLVTVTGGFGGASVDDLIADGSLVVA